MMNELKNRSDYRFVSERAPYFLPVIRAGEFDSFDDYMKKNGYFEKSLAMLEIGNVDVELNLQTESDPCGDGYINKAYPCYFCCVKGADGEWSSAGYLDDFGFDVEVDWSADDWLSQLEMDMAEKLDAFANKFDLSYDKPNGRNAFDVFDRLHDIIRKG